MADSKLTITPACLDELLAEAISIHQVPSFFLTPDVPKIF